MLPNPNIPTAAETKEQQTREIWQAFETPLGFVVNAKQTAQNATDEQSIELDHLLKHTYNQYLSKEEADKRMLALSELQEILNEWMRNALRKNNCFNEELIRDHVPFRFYTYGSYKLKLSNPGGDIDTVILALSKKHVTREKDFFEDLYEILKNQHKVTHLKKITTAKVPLLKMYYDGIQLDMGFANLECVDYIEEHFDKGEQESINNNKYLIGMDIQSIRSIDGVRVANKVTSLITSEDNFILVTKAIKLWAKKRAIYSNMMGFFSGILIAFLVVKIMQMFKSFSPFKILLRFFYIFSHEKAWKTKIYLDDIKKGREGLPEDLLQVERKYESTSETSIVKIFTPAFPCYNSSERISNYPRKVIIKQLNWGYRRINAITKGEKDPLTGQPYKMKDLFEEFDFFDEYHHFLQMNILSNAEKSDYNDWKGFVESNISFLIQNYFEKNLEMDKAFEFIHLNPEPREDMNIPEFKHHCTYFFGIRFKKEVEREKMVNIHGFGNILHEWAMRIFTRFQSRPDIPADQFNLDVKYLKRDQLPPELLKKKNIFRSAMTTPAVGLPQQQANASKPLKKTTFNLSSKSTTVNPMNTTTTTAINTPMTKPAVPTHPTNGTNGFGHALTPTHPPVSMAGEKTNGNYSDGRGENSNGNSNISLTPTSNSPNNDNNMIQLGDLLKAPEIAEPAMAKHFKEN